MQLVFEEKPLSLKHEIRKSLTRVESTSKPKLHISSNKATKRVIAPYVKIIRRGQQSVPERLEESKYLGFDLEKKPSTLLEDLSTFLSDAVDFSSLLHQTADVLKLVSRAAGVTLYLVDFGQEEIHLSQKNVPGERNKVRWKIQQGSTIAAYVAFKKQLILLDRFIFDEKFPEGLGYKDEVLGSILCVPVVTPEGDCFAVIELYRNTLGDKFEKKSVQITVAVAGWIGAAIHQNQLRVALNNQQQMSDYLLYLTKCYFGGALTMEKLVTAIVKFAKECLGAERGLLYVLDKESDDFLADLFEEGIEDNDLYKKNVKVRIGKDRAIVSYVVRTGNTVNIKDAYNDTRFNKEADQRVGFITRSMLCMAVKSFEETLGVVQVCNKRVGGSFTKIDEEICNTFASYCALALHYYNLRKHSEKTDRLNKCHLKLLTRQMEPCSHDLDSFAANPEIPVSKEFSTFRWYITPETLYQLSHYAFFMIVDIIGRDNLFIEKLYQFILTCKKNYQFIAYHNFEHGFNVCHCMYNILIRNMNRFSILESKSLIIASLCHDVDHPGYTNNYLAMTRDNLAILYEESILENHHYRTTILMLNYCNVYANVNEFTFKQISKEIKEAIIATDLALYFRFRGRLLQIVKDNVLEFGNTAHRSLVKAIMMTSCDLSGQCKPFNVARRITENVYKEFYKQGDEEKKRGFTPLSMMDREKHHMIPEDQVQFLSVVVLPCIDILQKVFPNCSEMFDLATELKAAWQVVIDLRNTLAKPWQKVIEDDIPSELLGD